MYADSRDSATRLKGSQVFFGVEFFSAPKRNHHRLLHTFPPAKHNQLHQRVDHDRQKDERQVHARPFIHAPGQFVAALFPDRPGRI